MNPHGPVVVVAVVVYASDSVLYAETVQDTAWFAETFARGIVDDGEGLGASYCYRKGISVEVRSDAVAVAVVGDLDVMHLGRS